MNSASIAPYIGLAVALVTAAFAYASARKSSDDTRAIGLINAGQVALERALERATLEIQQSNQRVTSLQRELQSVKAELRQVLVAHADCEDDRKRLALRLTMRGEETK